MAIAVRFIPILEGWISSHDRNPGSGQFLLNAPAPLGLKQLVYLLAYVQGLTLSVVLTGVVGIYLLWRGRDRVLALFLTSLAVSLIPVASVLYDARRSSSRTSVEMRGLVRMFLVILLIEAASLIGNYY